MPTLTLTLDDDLLARAEAYAQRTGTDLSALVAGALWPIVTAEPRSRRPLSPQVQALVGSISLPPNAGYKDYVTQVINERHIP